ncbi:hypothetical protein [Methylorubrum populi]|uniref:hypothetical protein n=1 Tax=Methylorubrum populi TaxID=223967 RepID=UPI00156FB77D|nr:hypothetical protein [Methylorubrum populi]
MERRRYRGGPDWRLRANIHRASTASAISTLAQTQLKSVAAAVAGAELEPEGPVSEIGGAGFVA